MWQTKGSQRNKITRKHVDKVPGEGGVKCVFLGNIYMPLLSKNAVDENQQEFQNDMRENAVQFLSCWKHRYNKIDVERDNSMQE